MYQVGERWARLKLEQVDHEGRSGLYVGGKNMTQGIFDVATDTTMSPIQAARDAALYAAGLGTGALSNKRKGPTSAKDFRTRFQEATNAFHTKQHGDWSGLNDSQKRIALSAFGITSSDSSISSSKFGLLAAPFMSSMGLVPGVHDSDTGDGRMMIARDAQFAFSTPQSGLEFDQQGVLSPFSAGKIGKAMKRAARSRYAADGLHQYKTDGQSFIIQKIGFSSGPEVGAGRSVGSTDALKRMGMTESMLRRERISPSDVADGFGFIASAGDLTKNRRSIPIAMVGKDDHQDRVSLPVGGYDGGRINNLYFGIGVGAAEVGALSKRFGHIPEMEHLRSMDAYLEASSSQSGRDALGRVVSHVKSGLGQDNTVVETLPSRGFQVGAYVSMMFPATSVKDSANKLSIGYVSGMSESLQKRGIDRVQALGDVKNKRLFSANVVRGLSLLQGDQYYGSVATKVQSAIADMRTANEPINEQTLEPLFSRFSDEIDAAYQKSGYYPVAQHAASFVPEYSGRQSMSIDQIERLMASSPQTAQRLIEQNARNNPSLSVYQAVTDRATKSLSAPLMVEEGRQKVQARQMLEQLKAQGIGPNDAIKIGTSSLPSLRAALSIGKSGSWKDYVYAMTAEGDAASNAARSYVDNHLMPIYESEDFRKRAVQIKSDAGSFERYTAASPSESGSPVREIGLDVAKKLARQMGVKSDEFKSFVRQINYGNLYSEDARVPLLGEEPTIFRSKVVSTHKGVSYPAQFSGAQAGDFDLDPALSTVMSKWEDGKLVPLGEIKNSYKSQKNLNARMIERMASFGGVDAYQSHVRAMRKELRAQGQNRKITPYESVFGVDINGGYIPGFNPVVGGNAQNPFVDEHTTTYQNTSGMFWTGKINPTTVLKDSVNAPLKALTGAEIVDVKQSEARTKMQMGVYNMIRPFEDLLRSKSGDIERAFSGRMKTLERAGGNATDVAAKGLYRMYQGPLDNNELHESLQKAFTRYNTGGMNSLSSGKSALPGLIEGMVRDGTSPETVGALFGSNSGEMTAIADNARSFQSFLSGDGPRPEMSPASALQAIGSQGGAVGQIFDASAALNIRVKNKNASPDQIAWAAEQKYSNPFYSSVASARRRISGAKEFFGAHESEGAFQAIESAAGFAAAQGPMYGPTAPPSSGPRQYAPDGSEIHSDPYDIGYTSVPAFSPSYSSSELDLAKRLKSRFDPSGKHVSATGTTIAAFLDKGVYSTFARSHAATFVVDNVAKELGLPGRVLKTSAKFFEKGLAYEKEINSLVESDNSKALRYGYSLDGANLSFTNDEGTQTHFHPDRYMPDSSGSGSYLIETKTGKDASLISEMIGSELGASGELVSRKSDGKWSKQARIYPEYARKAAEQDPVGTLSEVKKALMANHPSLDDERASSLADRFVRDARSGTMSPRIVARDKSVFESSGNFEGSEFVGGLDAYTPGEVDGIISSFGSEIPAVVEQGTATAKTIFEDLASSGGSPVDIGNGIMAEINPDWQPALTGKARADAISRIKSGIQIARDFAGMRPPPASGGSGGSSGRGAGTGGGGGSPPDPFVPSGGPSGGDPLHASLNSVARALLDQSSMLSSWVREQRKSGKKLAPRRTFSAPGVALGDARGSFAEMINSVFDESGDTVGSFNSNAPQMKNLGADAAKILAIGGNIDSMNFSTSDIKSRLSAVFAAGMDVDWDTSDDAQVKAKKALGGLANKMVGMVREGPAYMERRAAGKARESSGSIRDLFHDYSSWNIEASEKNQIGSFMTSLAKATKAMEAFEGAVVEGGKSTKDLGKLHSDMVQSAKELRGARQGLAGTPTIAGNPDYKEHVGMAKNVEQALFAGFKPGARGFSMAMKAGGQDFAEGLAGKSELADTGNDMRGLRPDRLLSGYFAFQALRGIRYTFGAVTGAGREYGEKQEAVNSMLAERGLGVRSVDLASGRYSLARDNMSFAFGRQANMMLDGFGSLIGQAGSAANGPLGALAAVGLPALGAGGIAMSAASMMGPTSTIAKYAGRIGLGVAAATALIGGSSYLVGASNDRAGGILGNANPTTFGDLISGKTNFSTFVSGSLMDLRGSVFASEEERKEYYKDKESSLNVNERLNNPFNIKGLSPIEVQSLSRSGEIAGSWLQSLSAKYGLSNQTAQAIYGQAMAASIPENMRPGFAAALGHYSSMQVDPSQLIGMAEQIQGARGNNYSGAAEEFFLGNRMSPAEYRSALRFEEATGGFVGRGQLRNNLNSIEYGRATSPAAMRRTGNYQALQMMRGWNPQELAIYNSTGMNGQLDRYAQAAVNTPGGEYAMQAMGSGDPFMLTKMAQSGMISGPLATAIGGGMVDVTTGGELGRRSMFGIGVSTPRMPTIAEANSLFSSYSTRQMNLAGSRTNIWNRGNQTTNSQIINAAMTNGFRGLQMLSAQYGYEAQMASAGVQAAQARLGHQYAVNISQPMQLAGIQMDYASKFGGVVQTEWMRKNGVPAYNAGAGQFAWAQRSMDMQKKDLEVGNTQNMARLGWQLEDIGRDQYRSGVRYGWQREDFTASRQQTMANRGFQMYEFGMQRQEAALTRQYFREDFAFNRQVKEKQFGWAMEDYGQAIRRSTGYERKQLIKQRDRDTEMNNLTNEQENKQKKRQEDQFKREDEHADKQLEHIKKMQEMEDEAAERQEKRMETEQEWREEDFGVRRGRVQQEMTWAQESHQRALENFKIREEQLAAEISAAQTGHSMAMVRYDADVKHEEASYKLQLAAAGVGARHAEQQAKLQLATEGMQESIEKQVDAQKKFWQETNWDKVKAAFEAITKLVEKAVNSAPSAGDNGPGNGNIPGPPSGGESPYGNYTPPVNRGPPQSKTDQFKGQMSGSVFNSSGDNMIVIPVYLDGNQIAESVFSKGTAAAKKNVARSRRW